VDVTDDFEKERRATAADPAGVAGLDALMPLLYAELRSIARRYLRHERSGHTLAPTALVHEAYLRLSAQHSVAWAGRSHVLALAAQMMRRILVNHAVAQRRAKRGSGIVPITVDDEAAFGAAPDADVEGIDRALGALAALDARQAQIVEMRVFAGMAIEEIATVLDISAATVKRDWATARLWLKRELA